MKIHDDRLENPAGNGGNEVTEADNAFSNNAFSASDGVTEDAASELQGVQQPKRFPKGLGTPTAYWVYRDPAGQPVAVVYRFDPPEGKTYRPWSSIDGVWQWKAPPHPRPLYGLDHLAGRPEAPVILCEGEKAVDAAARLLPESVAVASMNGAQSSEQTDWSPLFDRRVLIWPDADPPGLAYAQKVAAAARAAGAQSVGIIDVHSLWGTSLADKVDAADWPPGEALPEPLPLILEVEGSGGPTGPDDAFQPAKPVRPYYFMVDASGQVSGGKGEEFEAGCCPGLYCVAVTEIKLHGEKILVYARPAWISIPFELLATCDDGRGYGYGIAIRFVAQHGQVHTWTVPRSLLVAEGRELFQRLYDMGFRMDIKLGPIHLRDYLNRAKPELQALSVTKIGWVRDRFVLPDHIFGADPGGVFYQSDDPRPSPYTVAGTLHGWTEEVARRCEPYDLPVFAICTAFAAPLLALLAIQTGGFHLVGSTTSGKSSVTHWALSVWGFFKELLQQWHGTLVGFETTASTFCDGLMVLDELGQAEPRDVGNLVYLLANEVGKMRGTQRLTQRPLHRWKLLVLSSGEKTLGQVMAEGGKTPMAGQELRLINIPVDAGDQCGIFPGLLDEKQRANLADGISLAARQHYGHPIRRFLERLTSPEILAQLERARSQVTQLAADIAGEGANSEVRRAALRFAVVAYGGEVATQWDITGWRAGRATEATRALFQRWRDTWGPGRRDETNFLEHFDRWLSGHQMAHFAEIDPKTKHTTEESRARIVNMRPFFGYVANDPELGGRRYYLNAAGWASATEGVDRDLAIAALTRVGRLLAKDPKRNTGKSDRVGDMVSHRYYVIRGDSEGESEAED